MKNLDYIEGFLDCKKQALEIIKTWDMEFRIRCLKEIEQTLIPYEESEIEFFDMVKHANNLLSNVRPQSIS